ncbi:MAG: FctA domain-containing protein [Clostridia bacterium]|nr:FctA domain-containing protein [Clostridia bacterium]
MSIKKIISKIAALGMTAAIVATMGIAALADEVTTPAYKQDGSITKTLAVAENVTVPNISFAYTVAAGTAITASEGQNEVYAGSATGLSIATINFATTDDTGLAAETITKTSTISVVEEYTKPGIYNYVVTETPTLVDGVSAETRTISVDVYVVRGENGFVVDGILCYENGSKTDFDADLTYVTNTLTIKKVLSGNQADMNSTWQMNLALTNTDADNAPITIVNNGVSEAVSASYTLGHNGTVTIYGLTANDTFNVVETLQNTDGYTTTYELDEAESTADAVTAVGTADHTVVVTNDKSVTTPTGIVLTYGPYVLIALAAVVVGFFFLRKKNTAE